MARKVLSKKSRFEIFKRDSFTCQYCGRKAPDVVLQIDHLEPVSKGGTNDLLNLITSCKACNSGKSDRKLSDNSVIEKQRIQLEELQQRREQIEMMFKWQKEMAILDTIILNQLADLWKELVSPFMLNDNGLITLKKLIKDFQLNEIMESMRIAVHQYVEYKDDSPTQSSVEKAWQKIGGICSNRKREIERPYLKRLHYIKGILRNRLSYFNEDLAMVLLEKAVMLGADINNLELHAKEVNNWTAWRVDIDDLIEEKSEKVN